MSRMKQLLETQGHKIKNCGACGQIKPDHLENCPYAPAPKELHPALEKLKRDWEEAKSKNSAAA